MPNPRILLITTFGLGYLRPAPGTWGSLPPVALYSLALALNCCHQLRDLALLLILIAFSLICLLFTRDAEARFAKKDPSHVVADETAGQCIPLLFLPAAALGGPSIVGGFTLGAAVTLATAFLLFRIMDVIKPPPAHSLQRLPAGYGVLIDDLLAGLYAAILTQLLARFVIPLALPA